jgi:hypothetical protein
MRQSHFAFVAAALLIAGTVSAGAQNQPRGQQPTAAAAKPYKPVAVTPPAPMTDASFDSFRKQLGEVAQRKDRAALTPLVVAQSFFWVRDKRESADKRKSGFDNLSTALSLSNKDGVGWDILAGYADDPTASPSATHKGAFCAPADPAYNAQEFDALLKATASDVSEWSYPVSAGTEVRATAQANAPVVENLDLVFVRVSPENKASSAAFVRVITPAGNAGFVSVDEIAPLGNDQICYVKDGAAWKIVGYIGGGEPQ